MRLRITIDCDSEAFEDCAGDEAARIIERLLPHLRGRHLIGKEQTPLRDANGERVGWLHLYKKPTGRKS